MQAPNSFYVMIEIEGSEIVLAHCDNYRTALARARSELKARPDHAPSVWGAGGAMLAVTDERRRTIREVPHHQP